MPPEIKEAITSVDTTRILHGIGEKYKLHIDKIGMLADETGAVMLGITHPTKFTSDLKSKLGLNEEIVKAIAEDVNVQIFRPIRESLKKIHGIGEISKPLVTFTKPDSQIATQDMMAPFQPPSIIRGAGEATAKTSSASETFGAAEAAKTLEDLRKNAMQKTEIETMPKEGGVEDSIAASASLASNAPKIPGVSPANTSSEANPSRTKILSEIENPSPSPVISEKFIDDKMAGMTRMPSEIKETSVIAKPPSPPTPPSPSKNYPVDPYREPTK